MENINLLITAAVGNIEWALKEWNELMTAGKVIEAKIYAEIILKNQAFLAQYGIN